MDLFRRFPKVYLSVKELNLVPEEDQNAYPAFTEDFAILTRELLPTFYQMDKQAEQRQNAYRWMYVILIFGGSLATILGITQLVIDGIWVGLAGAVVAALLGITTLYVRSFNHQERYLNARIKAELLRAEYFLFLGHFAPYDDQQEREAKLIERVIEIKLGDENHAEV